MSQLDRGIERIAEKGRRLTVEARKFLDQLGKSEKDLINILERALKRGDGIFITREDIEEVLKEVEEISPPPEVTSSAQVFKPEADAIETRINLMYDPGKRAKPVEKKEDFLALFRDRYRKERDIISRRLGIRRIGSVAEAISLGKDESIIIAGLVAGRRFVKNGLWIEIEDMKNKVSVFVHNRNPELYETSKLVPLDSVIALRIKRVREKLIVAEDIYLPEINDKQPRRSEEEVYTILTSDFHIGSKLFLKGVYSRFIQWLRGEFGGEREREIASKTKYIIIAGDIIDGVGVYPSQELELEEIQVKKQYKMAYQLLDQIPDHIKIIILPGNHDATRRALPQPPIIRDYAEPFYDSDRFHMTGNPIQLELHGVNIYSFHGRSLDDCVSTMPGIRQNNITEAMKILLRIRHIAPIYGLNERILPQKEDTLVIPMSPDIFHAGHMHINNYLYYKNTLVLNSGTWQEQTLYQRERGLIPTPGLVPIINLSNLKLQQLRFI